MRKFTVISILIILSFLCGTSTPAAAAPWESKVEPWVLETAAQAKAGDLAAILTNLQAGDILFIDEIHNIIGAGSATGSMDAANILKPALARGELQMVGATTIEEYRKYVEKDAALERRFQPIMVEEPSTKDTVEILKGLRERYEKHHNVRITDEAIETAVKMSDRYISDRFLPDKAIDLIDEAASRLRLCWMASGRQG